MAEATAEAKTAEELRRERVAKHIDFLDKCQAVSEDEGSASKVEPSVEATQQPTADERAAAALLEKARRGERAKAAAEEKARAKAMEALRAEALETKVKGNYESQQRVLQLQKENELIRKCLEGKGSSGAGDEAASTLQF